jgi:predicted transcriptional regulator
MTKKKTKNALVIELQKQLPQNPVAKFAHHVNKSGFFRDRTMYSRKGKHKDCESFPISYLAMVNNKRLVSGVNAVKLSQPILRLSTHSSMPCGGLNFKT